MPTYEYRCTNCGRHTEVVQSFSDDPLSECPHCGQKALRKVFSPVGIVFKGSGFYKTDNRGGKGGAHKMTDKDLASSSSSSSSDKSGSSDKSSDKSSSSSSPSKTDSKIA
jgi:putative FmdB family regulatory protein